MAASGIPQLATGPQKCVLELIIMLILSTTESNFINTLDGTVPLFIWRSVVIGAHKHEMFCSVCSVLCSVLLCVLFCSVSQLNIITVVTLFKAE